jgi:hypothetical protein
VSGKVHVSQNRNWVVDYRSLIANLFTQYLRRYCQKVPNANKGVAHKLSVVFCVPIFVCAQCLHRKSCYLPGSGHCLTSYPYVNSDSTIQTGAMQNHCCPCYSSLTTTRQDRRLIACTTAATGSTITHC